jgi:hypothetical protein
LLLPDLLLHKKLLLLLLLLVAQHAASVSLLPTRMCDFDEHFIRQHLLLPLLSAKSPPAVFDLDATSLRCICCCQCYQL